MATYYLVPFAFSLSLFTAQPEWLLQNTHMAEATYHIRIKKKYAGSVIKDLQKLDAVELITEEAVPEWQQKEVRKRLKSMQKNPAKGLEWSKAVKKIR
jgi:hypothetical protein